MESAMKSKTAMTSSEFADATELYHGPRTSVRFGKEGKVYWVSKPLVTAHSKFFVKELEMPNPEEPDGPVTFPVVNGVVTAQAFELLLQWLYIGMFNLEHNEDPTVSISRLIEFARFVHHAEVRNSDLQRDITAKIKEIILANHPPDDRDFYARHPDANTRYLTTDHLKSAVNLTLEHPVRAMLAKASIQGHLRSKDWKFAREAKTLPGFRDDIRVEAELIYEHTFRNGANVWFTDPITGTLVPRDGG